MLIWLKTRRNYVEPLNTIHLRLKDASKFGWTFKGPDGTGDTTEISLETFTKFLPTVLEISDPPCNAREFFNYMSNPEVIGDLDGRGFLKNCKHVRIFNAQCEPEVLQWILTDATSLESFEYHDWAHIKQFDRVAELLGQRDIKYFDFVYPWNTKEMETFISKCKQLRILRLSAPPGVDLSAFLAVQTPIYSLKFIGFLDVCHDTSFDERIFSHLSKIAPNVEFLMLDWNMRTEEITWTESDKHFVTKLAEFHRKKNLTMTAINIYTPAPEMQDAAKSLGEHLKSEFRKKSLSLPGNAKVSIYPYGSSGLMGVTSNFTMIMIGDQNCIEAQRMREMFFEHSSSPDLRHLAYVLDGKTWHKPDITLEFGGMSDARVKQNMSNGTPEVITIPEMSERHFDL